MEKLKQEAVIDKIRYLGLTILGLMLYVSTSVIGAEIWTRIPPAEDMPPAEMTGFAPVNKINMYYAVYGDNKKTPLLLIHGGLGHADLWGSQVASLSEEFRVIVADTRGHGRSTHDGQPLSYELLADDYLALLDHLQIEKVYLVGWSDGANIGYQIALNAPERLASHFAFAGNVTVDAIHPTVQNDEVFAAYVRMMASDYAILSNGKIPFETLLADLSLLWSTEKPGGLQALQDVEVPTFVVHAAQDEAIKFDHALEIRLAIQPSGLIVIGGASHFAPLQVPDRFTELIRLTLAGRGGSD